jgi:hypothetical protein
MTMVVGVHGIGNYSYMARLGSVAAAAQAISTDWGDALDKGLAGFDAQPSARPELRVAYYAHLLHRGTPQGDGDPASLDDYAQDLLIGWVDQLIPAEMAPVPQGPRTARVRAAGDWVTCHLGDRALGFALKFCREASSYLSSISRRQAVRDAVAEAIARDRPEVLIAHSLGSVVAYETLWWYPELPIELLLTAGSPLAMPKVIFDRLDPKPVNGRGQRPPGATAWANLADIGDIVAIPRTGLAPCFDGVTYDNPAIVIDKNASHAVHHYLAARETTEILAPLITGRFPAPRS